MDRMGAGPRERRDVGVLSLGVGRVTKRSARAAGRTMFVGFEDPEVERRRELTNFINEELDVIDEGLLLCHLARECTSHYLTSFALQLFALVFYYCLVFSKQNLSIASECYFWTAFKVYAGAVVCFVNCYVWFSRAGYFFSRFFFFFFISLCPPMQ